MTLLLKLGSLSNRKEIALLLGLLVPVAFIIPSNLTNSLVSRGSTILPILQDFPENKTMVSEGFIAAQRGYYYFPSLSLGGVRDSNGKLAAGHLLFSFPTFIGNIAIETTYDKRLEEDLLGVSTSIGRSINHNWSLGLSLDLDTADHGAFYASFNPSISWRKSKTTAIAAGFGIHQLTWTTTTIYMGTGDLAYKPAIVNVVGVNFLNFHGSRVKAIFSLQNNPYNQQAVGGTGLSLYSGNWFFSLAKYHAESLQEQEFFGGSVGFNPTWLSDWKIIYSGAKLESNDARHKINITKTFFSADIRQPRLNCSAPRKVFSPNADSIQDTVTVHINVEDESQIKSWKAEFINENKENKRVYQQSLLSLRKSLRLADVPKIFFSNRHHLRFPQEIEWDGRVFSETTAEQGQWPVYGNYTFKLSVTDEFGNESRCQLPGFVIDNERPEIKVSLPKDHFDLTSTDFPIALFEVSNAKDDDMVKIQVLNEKNKVILESNLLNKNFEPSYTWQGKLANGSGASTGVYKFKVSITDRGGNHSKAESKPFLLKAVDTGLFIQSNQTESLQSGNDTPLLLFLTKSSIEPIANWQLYTGTVEEPKIIYNRDGKLPTELVIDKKNPELLNKAGYQKWWIKAVTSNNKSLISNPVFFKTDRNPPQIRFSVDDASQNFLNNNLKFSFYSSIADKSDIKDYDLTIYLIGKKRERFFTLKNNGMPPRSLAWSGISQSGVTAKSFELFEAGLTVTDNFGNRATSKPVFFKTGVVIEPELVTPTIITKSLAFAPQEKFILSSDFMKLEVIGDFFQRYPDANIEVRVYCESEKDYAKNMDLSEQRAKWLVGWFIKNGINKERFTFNGRGSIKDRENTGSLTTVAIRLSAPSSRK